MDEAQEKLQALKNEAAYYERRNATPVEAKETQEPSPAALRNRIKSAIARKEEELRKIRRDLELLNNHPEIEEALGLFEKY